MSVIGSSCDSSCSAQTIRIVVYLEDWYEGTSKLLLVPTVIVLWTRRGVIIRTENAYMYVIPTMRLRDVVYGVILDNNLCGIGAVPHVRIDW